MGSDFGELEVTHEMLKDKYETITRDRDDLEVVCRGHAVELRQAPQDYNQHLREMTATLARLDRGRRTRDEDPDRGIKTHECRSDTHDAQHRAVQ